MRLEYLIDENIKEIKSFAYSLKAGKENAKNFLKRMINLGSQLDQLFSLGEGEDPVFSTQEKLFDAYGHFKLGCCHTLLMSDFGLQHNLRQKYVELLENDGVHDILLPLTHPGSSQLTFNSEIRLGMRYDDSGITRASPEGIKQLKQAHKSLQKKIAILAVILRDETGKEVIGNRILVQIDEDNKKVSRFKNGETLTRPFRKVMGRNLRFEYLVKIAKSPSKVGARKLSNSATLQAISGEIRNVNSDLNDSLKFGAKKIIKNDNNTGYEIDRDLFEIEFVG